MAAFEVCIPDWTGRRDNADSWNPVEAFDARDAAAKEAENCNDDFFMGDLDVFVRGVGVAGVRYFKVSIEPNITYTAAERRMEDSTQ